MSIVVSGDADFQAHVLAGLQAICPCRSISLVGGTVVLGPSMDCCCTRPRGCNLLESLVGTGSPPCAAQVTIKHAEASTYLAYAITLDPLETIESCANMDPAPPSVTLAHELIHAYVECQGGESWNEKLVSCAENQIREEMGVAPRCRYGATPIEPGCGWLAGQWKPDQSCSWYKTLICWLLTLWRRLLSRMKVLFARVFASSAAPYEMSYREDADIWDWSQPPTLQQRVAQAYWVRSRESAARRIDRLVEDLESRDSPPPLIQMLERIVIGSPYRVSLSYQDGDATVVVTNWFPPDISWAPRRPRLIRARFAAGESYGLEHLTFEHGSGGREEVADGATSILTLKRPGEDARRAVSYGIDTARDAGETSGLGPVDVERWANIRAFRESLMQLMRTQTPSSIEVL
ncbi:MAG TPA: hypothetical protein VMM35_08010 [Longimicrobiales bacterium]|nr:hypothetical protein [Longimicrobiales bacterium]